MIYPFSISLRAHFISIMYITAFILKPRAQTTNVLGTSRQSRMIKKMAKTMMAHRVLVPLFILLNHTMERFSFDFNPNEIPSFKASTTMPAQIDICNDMMVQLLLFMKHHIVPKYRYCLHVGLMLVEVALL